MAFQFIELPDHFETTSLPPTLTRKYKAIGESSQSYVHAYSLGATPGIVSTIQGTLYRQDLRMSQVAYNQFMVTVPYGVRKNETGEWSFNFDTTGGTVHITNAKQEIGRFPPSTAPDQKGAIGVEGDKVNGTEIVIPAMKVNVDFKHPLGTVTIAHAKYLASITGTTNSDNFLTFAPGEVLFLGARGGDGSVAEATVGYQFAMSSNASGLSIGDIASIAKKGWEYLWVRYEDTETDVSGTKHPTRIPKFVYVDRVYEEIAMATALGFGSG